MMKRAALMAAMLLGVPESLSAQQGQPGEIPPANGATGGSDLGIEILSAASSTTVSDIRLFTKKVCPNAAENLHLCGVILQEDILKPLPPAISTPAFVVDLPSKGTALVNWRGTAYCEMLPYSRNLDVSTTISFVLNMQIQSDKATDPEYNGPGYGAVGLRSYDYKPDDFNPQSNNKNFYLYPVNLTRTFNIQKGGKARYFLRAKAEFRTADRGVCNINGGEMTVLFLKS